MKAVIGKALVLCFHLHVRHCGWRLLGCNFGPPPKLFQHEVALISRMFSCASNVKPEVEMALSGIAGCI